MRTEFLEVGTIEAAQAAAPWAAEIVEVDGGFMAFESMADYNQFSKSEKSMPTKTKDGLTIYDIDPSSSELWVVAGPAGYKVSQIDADDLPEGFRWVTNEEWEELQAAS